MNKILYAFLTVALFHLGFVNISVAQEEFPARDASQQADIEQNVSDMLNLFDELQNDKEMSKELGLLKEGKNNTEKSAPPEPFSQSEKIPNPTRDSAGKNIETANEVVRFDADTPESHFQLGLEHWLAKNLVAAINQFQEVIRVAPENAHAYWNLALLYNENNQGPEAIAYIKKARAIYSKYEYTAYAEEARKRLNGYLEKYGDSAMSIPSPE